MGADAVHQAPDDKRMLSGPYLVIRTHTVSNGHATSDIMRDAMAAGRTLRQQPHTPREFGFVGLELSQAWSQLLLRNVVSGGLGYHLITLGQVQWDVLRAVESA